MVGRSEGQACPFPLQIWCYQVREIGEADLDFVLAVNLHIIDKDPTELIIGVDVGFMHP